MKGAFRVSIPADALRAHVEALLGALDVPADIARKLGVPPVRGL